MPDENKLPPPVQQSSDMSIHLSYIRRDIDEIKINQQRAHEENVKNFNDLKNGFVTRLDFDEHLKADADHETRIRTIEDIFGDVKTIKKLVFGCVGTILVSVLTAIIYLVLHK